MQLLHPNKVRFTVLHLRKRLNRGAVLLWRWVEVLRWRIRKEGGRVLEVKETRINPAPPGVVRGDSSQKIAGIRIILQNLR